MRVALERLARRWWEGELGASGVALGVLSAPLAWAWAGASRGRARRLAGRGARIPGLSVVSVGNLAVGGTGKTPVAAWVARRLSRAGLSTSVITGGHGGDEALLHRRWSPDVPVVVARDRVGAATVARGAGACAAVLDDGFQHLRLARDLDVVLLTADDPFPGPVLPRGPYREGPSALARAHVIVVTSRVASEAAARALAARASEHAPGALTAGVRVAPAALLPLASWADAAGQAAGRGDGLRVPGPVLAVCGVARPEAVRAFVADLVDGRVELLAFADHHAYTRVDVARIRARAAGRPIAMTEKDAVKLARYASELAPAYVLTEELRWAWGESALSGLLDAVVAGGVRR